MTNEVKILLASPRGFCAGVDRAIDIVEKTLKKFVYILRIKTNTTITEAAPA